MAKKLVNYISDRWGWDSRVLRFYSYYHNGDKRKTCAAMIKDHFGDGLSEKEVRRHMKLMRRAYLIDMWRFDEYFLYKYYTRSRSEIRQYVTEREKIQFCMNVQSQEAIDTLCNKNLTYKQYSQYYKRDVLVVKEPLSMRSEIEQFVSKHQSLVIKPSDTGGGELVNVINDASWDKLEQMFVEYPEGFILEEFIEQGEGMAVLHPESVNTLRITTLVTDGKIHYFLPTARIGRGDNRIDNVSKGGLSCAIDFETGKIIYVGDNEGNLYEKNPDNGMMLIGYQIPEWKEAINLVEKMVNERPDFRYVGWDLAYSTKGWVLVEGNALGQFIGMQLSTQKGIRSELLAADKNCLAPRRTGKVVINKY